MLLRRELLRRELVGGFEGLFRFDANAASFTPSMAKRAGAVFAAAPIVQGDWATANGDADLLTFGRGTQISGNFYQNWDGEQGNGTLFVKPEWAGGDGVKHVFCQWSTNGMLYKDTDNKLYLSVASGVSISVSISAWVAGTTYAVSWAWDADNSIDGTNYLRLSANDAHTFGRTTAFTAEAPLASVCWGHDSNTQNPANAILGGGVIYRRVLWDGTYGINVGNGDEINLIYAAGAGKDPCLVTGSWDVVFCLPTNSTVGALATGTGNAWSHPHSSNLITPVDGFMLSTAWANYTAEGSPINPAVMDAAQKIYQGGYQYESDAADEGYYWPVTVAAGNDWVIRVPAHSDGTSIPKCILYDQTNGAEIGSLTGTNTSTKAAPNVFIFTGEAPAGCTALRVKMVNTQASGVTYWHQVELLANLMTNPSMQGGAGDPYIPTGWTNVGLDAGDSLQETTVVHSGTDSLEYATGASLEGVSQLPIHTKAGKFFVGGAWTYGDGVRTTRLTNGNSNLDLQATSSTNANILGNVATSWGHTVWVARVDGNSAIGSYLSAESNASAKRYVDDAYFFQLDDVSLTATPASEANSAETSGLRVDGRDACTQPITNLTTTKGTIKFNWTPRHSAADAVKFLEVTDAHIAAFRADASNYIRAYWNAANTVTLLYNMNGGGDVSTTWDATGAIAAGTTYAMQIDYTGGGAMTLRVDGATKITLSSIPAAFGTAPSTAYWGGNSSSARQGDASFA